MEQQLPVHLRPTLARLTCEADNLSPYVNAADELYGSDAAAQRRVTVSAVEAAPVAAVTPAGGGPKSSQKRGGGSKRGGGNKKLVDGKCTTHSRYGKDAYTCQNPSACKMKDVLKPRPKVAEVQDNDE